MKTHVLKRSAGMFGLGVILGFRAANPAWGETPCSFALPPAPGNSAQITLSAPWALNGDATTANNPGYLAIQVNTGNAAVPASPYVAWCVDADTYIGPGPDDYDVLLYSSEDPTLNTRLPADRAISVYVSPEVWHQVNYLLNHKQGANFWNVQAAIWGLVGGPAPEAHLNGYYGLVPPADMDEVNGLLADAQANAAGWLLPCGGTIGVLAVIQSPNTLQILLLEVPCPCAGTVPLTPRAIELDVLAQLQALRVTVTDNAGGHKLDEAMGKLNESLSPSWWIDDSHLQPKQGDHVFDVDKDAVQKLQELADNNGALALLLRPTILRIVLSARTLVEVAIQGVSGKELAGALKELAKGDASDKAQDAIDHYKSAWKKAMNR